MTVPTRALPLAAALAVAMTGCAPSTAPGSTAATAAPPRPSSPAPPDTAVARDGADVVQVEVATGAVTERVTVDGADDVDDLEHVGVRDVALLTRRAADGGDELVEVALDDDGGTRVLGAGSRPAVSGDGRHLAFVRSRPDGSRRELVAATYEGSEESSWPIEEATSEELEVIGLAWSASADELAVTLRTTAGTEVRVLPIDRTGTLRGASDAVEPTAHGAELVAATFRGPGRLTVAEGCCTPGSHERWRVLDVAPGTSTAREVVGELEGPVRHLDWDPALRHLAISVGTSSTTLHRWGPDGRHEVADGVTSAEW